MTKKIFFKEISFLRRLIFIIPFYLLYKNYFLGLIFKKFFKFYSYYYKKKNIFYLPNYTNSTFYSCFLTKTYEINDLFLIKKNLNKNCFPIIVGGGIGLITAICELITGKKIPTFEIDTNIIPILKKNLKINKLYSKCYNYLFYFKEKPKYKNIALSEEYISTTLYNQNVKVEKEKKNIRINRLNYMSYNYLSNITKTTYNTLIIDAEGYEYDLIKDLPLKSSIRHIFFELHSSIIGKRKTKDLFQQLKNKNFIYKDNFFNSYYFLHNENSTNIKFYI